MSELFIGGKRAVKRIGNGFGCGFLVAAAYAEGHLVASARAETHYRKKALCVGIAVAFCDHNI